MEPHPNFQATYPLSATLGLHPVSTSPGVQHGGFDIDEVAKALKDRFTDFEKTLKRVFCCAHRVWPSDHKEPMKRNSEVHVVYADDLETFLKGGA